LHNKGDYRLRSSRSANPCSRYEGLELDLQPKGHTIWECLFSHSVKARAIFFAEMLSPIAANPICLTTRFIMVVATKWDRIDCDDFDGCARSDCLPPASWLPVGLLAVAAA